jgi:hypothetical protein
MTRSRSPHFVSRVLPSPNAICLTRDDFECSASGLRTSLSRPRPHCLELHRLRTPTPAAPNANVSSFGVLRAVPRLGRHVGEGASRVGPSRKQALPEMTRCRVADASATRSIPLIGDRCHHLGVRITCLATGSVAETSVPDCDFAAPFAWRAMRHDAPSRSRVALI